MKHLLTAALVSFAALAAAPAGALPLPAPVEPAGLVEAAACRVIRERVERPNGSVVFRTRRECGPGGPGYGMRSMMRGDRGCRVVRERVERPNGSVVFRTRRTCG